MRDKALILLAVLTVMVGILGYYYFDQALTVWRILGFVVSLIVAFLLMMPTEMGRNIAAFSNKAVSEGKKVVWPARKEATQITGIVILGAMLSSLLIWAADSLIFKAVYDWVLGTV
ncbi:MAG: preprotein translocase subunit SecE [Neolewinella sp.]